VSQCQVSELQTPARSYRCYGNKWHGARCDVMMLTARRSGARNAQLEAR